GSCFPFTPTTSTTSTSSSSANTPSPTPTLKASRPSFAEPTSCPNASRTGSGSTTSSLLACASDTLLPTAVPPFDLRRIARTLPSGADEQEGPPTYKVLRDRGQPRAAWPPPCPLPDRAPSPS